MKEKSNITTRNGRERISSIYEEILNPFSRKLYIAGIKKEFNESEKELLKIYREQFLNRTMDQRTYEHLTRASDENFNYVIELLNKRRN